MIGTTGRGVVRISVKVQGLGEEEYYVNLDAITQVTFRSNQKLWLVAEVEYIGGSKDTLSGSAAQQLKAALNQHKLLT